MAPKNYIKKEVVLNPEKVVYPWVENQGIPTLNKAPINIGFMLFWILSVLTLLVIVKGSFYALHKTITIQLDEFDARPHVDFTLQSCDLSIQRSSQMREIRINYWTFMGDVVTNFDAEGLHGGKKTNITATVAMQSRIGTFACQVILLLDSEFEFGSFKLKVEAPLQKAGKEGASNSYAATTLELMAGNFMEGADLEVNDMSIINIAGVSSPPDKLFLLNNMAGGQIRITDEDQQSLPGQFHIKAVDSVVTARLQYTNANITTVNDTYVEFSAEVIEQEGVAWQLKNDVEGPSMTVHLDTDESPVLFTVVSKKSQEECKELQHHSGAGIADETPRLLAGGNHALAQLKEWLANPKRSFKFIVNFELISTRSLPGTLQLYSSKSYATVPLGYFAMISGGIMTPDILHITAPIVGVGGLVPKNACSGVIAGAVPAHDGVEYGLDFLDVVRKHIDINELELPKALWAWNVPGKRTFKFTQKKAHRSEEVTYKPHQIRPLVDGHDFYLANFLTMMIGLSCGFLVLFLLRVVFWPWMFKKINKDTLRRTASYRLEHTASTSTWTVSACLITWPIHGILLRWMQRPNFNLISKLKIEAIPQAVVGEQDGKDEAGEQQKTHPTIVVDDVDLGRLVEFPDCAGQKCFLLAAKPREINDNPPFFAGADAKFYEGLYGTGMMQKMRPLQRSLVVGEKYAISISSWAGKKKLETSDLSRDIQIRAPTAFVEIPLLMWKCLGGILPSDSFEHFLAECCQPVGLCPSLLLRLKNIKAFLVDDPTNMFAGGYDDYSANVTEKEAGTAAGRLQTAYLAQVAPGVKLAFSTGATADMSDQYIATGTRVLPSRNSRNDALKSPNTRIIQSLQDVENIFSKKGGGQGQMTLSTEVKNIFGKKKFVPFDFKPQGDTEVEIELRVGADLTQMINFEAHLMKGFAELDSSISFMMSWQALLSKLADQHYTDNFCLVLNDSMTPSGFLSFEVEYLNSEFHMMSSVAKATPKKGRQGDKRQVIAPSKPPDKCPLPNLFRSICPGSTIFWGEELTLTWAAIGKQSEPDVQKLFGNLEATIVCVSSPNLPDHWYADPATKTLEERSVVTKLMDVDLRSETAPKFTVTPLHNSSVQSMRCRLELRKKNGSIFEKSMLSQLNAKLSGTTSLVSADFLVTRPVSLQTLEIGYATFCSLNGIPMDRVPTSVMTNPAHGVEVVEKRFYQVKNFRNPLPIPMEEPCRMKEVAEDEGAGVVAAVGCSLITNSCGIIKATTQSGSMGKHQAFGEFGRRVKSMSTRMTKERSPKKLQHPLEQPLLQADAGDNEAPDSEATAKPLPAEFRKTNIATNVFWNFDKDWFKEPLLQYEFMLGNSLDDMLLNKIKSTTQLARNADGLKIQLMMKFLRFLKFFKSALCKFMLLLFQLIFLLLPSAFILGVWIFKDYVSSVVGEDQKVKGTVGYHLIGYLVAPSDLKWATLSTQSQWVYMFFSAYTFMTLTSIFYCNFCYDHIYHRFTSRILNVGVGTLYMAVIGVLALYSTVVLVWIMAGGLLNPKELLPLVIMVSGTLLVIYKVYSSMGQMRDYVSSKIGEKLSLALHAVMEVFCGDSAIDAQQDQADGDITSMADNSIVAMFQNEKVLRDKLMACSGIKPVTNGAEMASLKLLRSSSRFQLCMGIEGSVANNTLCSDFMSDEEAIALSQQIANREASLTGKRQGISKSVVGPDGKVREVMAGDQSSAPDEDINYESIVRAIAKSVKANMDRPGTYSDAEQIKFREMARTLNLSRALVQQTRDAFFVAMAMTEKPIAQLQNYATVAALFSNVRQKHLFAHFALKEHKLSVGDRVQARKRLDKAPDKSPTPALAIPPLEQLTGYVKELVDIEKKRNNASGVPVEKPSGVSAAKTQAYHKQSTLAGSADEIVDSGIPTLEFGTYDEGDIGTVQLIKDGTVQIEWANNQKSTLSLEDWNAVLQVPFEKEVTLKDRKSTAFYTYPKYMKQMALAFEDDWAADPYQPESGTTAEKNAAIKDRKEMRRGLEREQADIKWRANKQIRQYRSTTKDAEACSEQTPVATQMLATLENDDITGNVAVRTQTALTKIIDWARASAGVAAFLNSDLPQKFSDVHDEQSQAITQGGAALIVTLKACQKAYDDASFKEYTGSDPANPTGKPCQLLIDCGLITRETSQTTLLLQSAREWCRNCLPVFASTYTHMINMLFMPAYKEAWQGMDVNPTSYFWFNGLKLSLKQLGWTNDELKEDWLKDQWKKACDSTGDGLDLYGYEDYYGVQNMFGAVTAGHLWKAAVKSLMLQLGFGGYLVCESAAGEVNDAEDSVKKCTAAVIALSLSDPLDFLKLSEMDWPKWVDDIFNKYAATNLGDNAPKLLSAAQVIPFLQEVIYEELLDPTEQPKIGSDVDMINNAASNFAELNWFMCSGGKFGGKIWNSVPGGGLRAIRGLPYEAVRELIELSPSVPTDPKVFFQALQVEESSRMPSLQDLQKALSDEFVSKDDYCTFETFSILIRERLKASIPEKALKEQVFDKCPCVSGDSSAKQRSLSDLGAALCVWSGFGLWKEAIAEVVKEVVPYGPVRKLALQNLSVEFDKMDPDENGVVQPAAAIILIRKLAHPGLTFDMLCDFLNQSLNLTISPREMHSYFAMLDMQGDGVITVDEFIPMVRFLALDVFPMHVLASMGLSTSSILKYLLVILFFLGLVFSFISLVISIFSAGGDVMSGIKSGVTGLTVFCSKQMSEPNQGGGQSTVAGVEEHLNKIMVDMLATALGLSSTVIQRLQKMLNDLGG